MRLSDSPVPLPTLPAALLLLQYPASKRRPRLYYPRPLHHPIFAAAFAASAWMHFDGFPQEGALVCASWGALWLAVNGIGRGGLRPLVKLGRVQPALTTAAVAGVSVVEARGWWKDDWGDAGERHGGSD